MKAIIRTFIFLSLFCCTSVSAQEPDSAQYQFSDSTFRVGSIIFIGNEITKEYIIAHEMSLKIGSLITREAVKYDIERIYSLRLFTKVEIRVLPDSSTATLLVQVSERWYFYPFPIVGLKDRSWSKFYYGLGVTHTNFDGRNVRVHGSFALGYDPYISIGYTNPLIDEKNNLYFSTNAYYSIVRNRSLVSQGAGANFDEERFGGSTGAGKRFSLFSSASFSVDYTSISVSDNKAGRTLATNGNDKFFTLNASYRYDTRDLAEYPRIGTLISLGISKYGLGTEEVNYQRYSYDLRRYIPMYYDVVLAARMFGSAVGGGTVPNYGHVYYGYGERIRGHFFEIWEGENIFGSSAEFHYPLLKPSYFRIPKIPLEQFRDFRYALYFSAFADIGNVRYRRQPLELKEFLSGFGVGLNLLLAYSVVVRFEYAFGSPKFTNGEIIFDVGAAL